MLMLPTEIQLLELLVQNLPDALPSPPVEQSAYSIFLNFSLDLDFLERTEDEAGACNEIMKAIFGFEARTTGDGILTITECGPSVCAMVDIFAWMLDKFKGNAVIEKWLDDIIAGLQKTYNNTGIPVSQLGTTQVVLLIILNHCRSPPFHSHQRMDPQQSAR